MRSSETLWNKIEATPVSYLITFLILGGFFLYSKMLFNGFVWDDQDQLVNNPLIRHIDNIPYFFLHSTFYTGGAAVSLAGLYYRPMMLVLFTLTTMIWGISPFFFHLNNLLFHIGNSLLFFFLVKKILRLSNAAFAKTAAFIVSLLFLIHPANVESVAYISAVTEPMYTFFLLSGLLLSFSFGLDNHVSLRKLMAIFGVVVLCLFSKETGMIVLLFIPLAAFFYFRKRLLFLLLPLLSAFGVYGVFRFFLAQLSSVPNTSIMPITQATFGERLMTIPYELFSYLRIVFFPKDLHISQATVITGMMDPRFYFSLIVVLAILGCWTFLIRKVGSKTFIFFSLWLCLSLGMVLNIIPLDFTIEERWLYVPLLGFFGIVAAVLIKFLANKADKRLFTIFFVVAVVLLSFRTFIRTFDWVDPSTLFAHDVVLSDSSTELHTNYGTTLYSKGDIEGAKKEYTTALTLAPNNLWAMNNLGSIYATQGNYKEAIPLYQHSMNLAPTYASYENLALIYFLTEDPNKVLEFLQKALPVFPNSAKLNQLAALSYAKVGKLDEAKLYAQKSAQLDPSQENTTPLLPLLNQ